MFSSDTSESQVAWRAGLGARLRALLLFGLLVLSASCGGPGAEAFKSTLGSSKVLDAATASLDFGQVRVGEEKSLDVTFNNTGTASVTVSKVTVGGTGFSVSGFTLPLTVGSKESVSVKAKFAPTVAGSATGTVTVTSDASNSPASVSLTGTGIIGVLGTNPSSLDFGGTQVGQQKSLTLTLTNTGTTTLTISQRTITPAVFTLSGLTLPQTLNAGQSQNVTVTFKPTATGTVTGSVSFVSNASNSPTTVSLTGTGSAGGVLSVSPSSVSFGEVLVGQTKSQTETLTNSGSANLTITQTNVSNSAFRTSGLSLPSTLTPNQSRTFSVIFAPTSPGSQSGSVTLVSDARNSPNTILVGGTGITVGVLSLGPTSIDFGSVLVGQQKTQSATLTNTGSGSLTVSQANVSGSGFSISGLTLPLNLSAGAQRSFSVTFTPPSSGNFSGSITFVSDASNSPTVMGLAGAGSGARYVALSWNCFSASVTGFHIYRGTQSGGPYTKLTSSPVGCENYDDFSVSSGTTYFYVVTAVKPDGTESDNSNEARVSVP